VESGTVLGVVSESLGSTLAQDAAAGDETLYVTDVAYFSPGGGTLSIDDSVSEETELAYSGVDETTSTLTGVGPITNPYDALDTRVTVYPLVELQYAEVRLDGQQDTVRARLPYAIQQRVTDGYYSESNDETLRVLVELTEEGYTVVDIIGVVPQVAVNSLSVLDDLQVDGEFRISGSTPGTGVIEASVGIVLEGQQSAPNREPTLTQDWESITGFDPIASSDSANYSKFYYNTRRGAYWDTTANKILYCGSGTLSVRQVDPDGTNGVTVLSSVSNYFYGGVARVGAYYYVLAWYSPTNLMKVRKYDTAWVYQSEFTVADEGIPGVQMISEDGTDLWISDTRTTDGRMRLRRYSTAGVLQETLTGSSDYTITAGNQHYGYSARAADYGAETHALITEATLSRIRQMSSAGTYDGARVDSPATAWCAGLLWDGTNFWVMGNGSTISGYSYRLI
jgi:hypothetical protein